MSAPVDAFFDGVMVMAESRRSDAAIMLTSRLAGSPITIVPQSPDHVAEALQTRRLLLAGREGAS